MEGKYTEWPNPQITENHACDRQSGLNDSAPRKPHLRCLRRSGLINRATPCSPLFTEHVTSVLIYFALLLTGCGITVTVVSGRITIHFS